MVSNDSGLGVLSPTEFVSLANQTLEYAYNYVVLRGEVSEIRVSKGKWLYFNLKDDTSSLKCFGTVFNLRMPITDGMIIELAANPRLHNLYGFSMNVVSMRPVGEGSIKKSADILKAKLLAEGIFDYDRKRSLVFAPEKIALVASKDSAGYADFIKIIKKRWPLVQITHYDTLVQGVDAAESIISAINKANIDASAEVLVLIRGGGSADDLSAFSEESVVRAVATSRIPTIVAIGHETDESLAELAADQRASTPSNAAEILVPELSSEKINIKRIESIIDIKLHSFVKSRQQQINSLSEVLEKAIRHRVSMERLWAKSVSTIIDAYNPKNVLKRGYSVMRREGDIIRSVKSVSVGDEVTATLADGKLKLIVEEILNDK